MTRLGALLAVLMPVLLGTPGYAHEIRPAYLDMRDGPFQPEPMGPRSAKGRQKKAGP